MADQWKASVRTIDGRPVAVVDVTITRTILIDASAFEHIERLLRQGEGDDSGLTEVADFYRLVEALPPDSRRFVIVPWTDAESQQIGLRSLAEIVRFFEGRAYWRLEGSAATGFRGLFNFGGRDRVVDLSESAIPMFQQRVKETEADAVKALAAGEITPQQKQVVDALCKRYGEDSVTCLSLYKAHRDMVREQDRMERERQERELRDKEREKNDSGDGVVDFPGRYDKGPF